MTPTPENASEAPLLSHGFAARIFRAPKNAEGIKTCADAAEANLKTGVLAIADGVSDALRSGEWAKRLVSEFIQASPEQVQVMLKCPQELMEWIDSLRPHYASELAEWASNRGFFQQMKVEQSGSQATFFGVSIRSVPEGNADERMLSFAVVGDCCLFLFTPGSLKPGYSFPITSVAEFNTRPEVVGSRKEHGPTEELIQRNETSFPRGSFLVLATDALAARLISLDYEGLDWSVVRYWKAEEFGQWVMTERAERRLKDDDTTFLLLWDADPGEEEPVRTDWEEEELTRNERIPVLPPPLKQPAPPEPETPLLEQEPTSSPLVGEPAPVSPEEPPVTPEVPTKVEPDPAPIPAKSDELSRLRAAVVIPVPEMPTYFLNRSPESEPSISVPLGDGGTPKNASEPDTGEGDTGTLDALDSSPNDTAEPPHPFPMELLEQAADTEEAETEEEIDTSSEESDADDNQGSSALHKIASVLRKLASKIDK